MGYNFNDDLINSRWVKATLGGGSQKSETKSGGVKDKANYSVSYFAIEAGKRFALGDSKNISYAPSIQLTGASYGDDADDAGLDGGSEFRINLIKFDILL